MASANIEPRIERLHDLAKKTRAVAEAMNDLSFRRTTVLTAKSYERMANRLEVSDTTAVAARQIQSTA
jgi:hypothetical protein